MLPRLRRIHILFRFRLPFFYLALLGLAGQAPCRPTHIPRDSHNGLGRPLANQNLFQEPEVVRIAQNVLLEGDVVRECCTLTLTPISLSSGQPAIVLVKSCILEDGSGLSAGACGVNTTYAGSDSTSSTTSTTTSSSSTNVSITLSFTSVPALSTTNPAQPMSTVLASSLGSSSSLDPTLSSTSTPTASIPNLTTSSSPSTALPEESPTITSTTNPPATTSPVNDAVSSSPQQSSKLPQVLGGLAGAAVLLLGVAGTIGYIKQKKMARGEEPIRWPVTS